ncbi:hypothetical protein IB238_02455 [Rhizobium sp. ARZ01]|uniref:hypothetical protein n=1 Tax=Rhizobium sp. ARZ01 TaxID=2769313 RepID=UPI0017820572|nr:hypothetical protein [Rhizobium sp. ARZ01]MBD9371502.1 hypothetical protein [Rhizobium sp. ARZ01]
MTDVIPPRSKKIRKGLVLTLALPLAVATGLAALAQDTERPTQPGMMQPGMMQSGMEAGMHGERDGDRMDRGYHHGDHGRDRDRGPRRWQAGILGERLAIRLAAAETAAGIKVGQLDAWRTFTAAFVDFATPMPLRGGMMMDDEPAMTESEAAEVAPGSEEAQTPPAADQQPAGTDRADRGGFDMLDRMIARVENRAQKAEKLKAAKSALEGVLEPGQKETIARFLMPPRRFGGRD